MFYGCKKQTHKDSTVTFQIQNCGSNGNEKKNGKRKSKNRRFDTLWENCRFMRAPTMNINVKINKISSPAKPHNQQPLMPYISFLPSYTHTLPAMYIIII